MGTSVRTLRGFRDYLPRDMMAKDEMIARVRGVFESFGYPPLQTPVLEHGELLAGKYGEEGEMLMYRFRDHGDRDVCMRYDLTVPLARVVAQHGELTMPFRRYQVAPVWRAEKPGKGRFREFVQCDVDLVGVDDPGADAEMILIDIAVVRALGGGDGFRVRINHRGVLRGITRSLGISDGEQESAFLRLLDKLPKIGEEKFVAAVGEGFPLDDAAVGRLLDAIRVESDPRATLAKLAELVGSDDAGAAGLERLGVVLDHIEAAGDLARVTVDPSIARGLSYYTGIIFETFLDERPDFGSIMSGGRYDELIGELCGRDLPAVGISLGLDRLFDAFAGDREGEGRATPAEALVVRFGDEGAADSVALAAELRAGGIATVLYPSSAKLKKQFQHANNLGVPYVVLRGDDEKARGTATLRNMETGEQTELTVPEIVARLGGARDGG